ncbi:MAG: mechanosensitive ion channel family protein [Lachnospiraceae bacterium]|jgi:small conductance mechanosensitive channel|nr:mechanosensitive ion channel family protein [Lachnospiraceae bacterium]MCI1423519.1 mechanosensitive ion channel family protein [Lachnospiraceae bacterium]MCI1453398.1 mechanosensitive ion channel family protein [Lachnospiraceae bacterium]MDD5849454.1 mechanosensitive ion channel family protein [Bacillota bacterium]
MLTTESAAESTTIASLTESAADLADTAKEQFTWFSGMTEKLITFAIKLGICIAIYFIVTRLLKKILKNFDAHLEKRGVETTARKFFGRLIYYSVTILVVVTIIVQLNIVEGSTIAALIASAGVAISLAMQGVLSNFAGGVLLLVLHPFRVGDYIRLKDSSLEGTVTEIDMYYTQIVDVYGDKISIPNSELTGKSVENLVGGGLKGLIVTVGVAYGTDLAKAQAILQEIKDGEPRLVPDKGRVYVDSLGDSAIVLGIRGLVKASEYLDTLWDLNETVHRRLTEAGIEIPFNQLDVHIRKD